MPDLGILKTCIVIAALEQQWAGFMVKSRKRMHKGPLRDAEIARAQEQLQHASLAVLAAGYDRRAAR